mmetsp:Transcript_6741/g.18634  ORF Transcript_6741/g.18634 Transcript_6741/m.18634 type:complete len:366 (-) Transcript_6741:358-1455(-)
MWNSWRKAHAWLFWITVAFASLCAAKASASSASFLTSQSLRKPWPHCTCSRALSANAGEAAMPLPVNAASGLGVACSHASKRLLRFSCAATAAACRSTKSARSAMLSSSFALSDSTSVDHKCKNSRLQPSKRATDAFKRPSSATLKASWFGSVAFRKASWTCLSKSTVLGSNLVVKFPGPAAALLVDVDSVADVVVAAASVVVACDVDVVDATVVVTVVASVVVVVVVVGGNVVVVVVVAHSCMPGIWINVPLRSPMPEFSATLAHGPATPPQVYSTRTCRMCLREDPKLFWKNRTHLTTCPGGISMTMAHWPPGQEPPSRQDDCPKYAQVPKSRRSSPHGPGLFPPQQSHVYCSEVPPLASFVA